MNQLIRYTFKSHTGKVVTIRSRMGEDSARYGAMEHFWGPPAGWCENKGQGLSLIEQEPVEA